MKRKTVSLEIAGMLRTVIELLQVTALPQSSVARNVRVYTIGELPEEVSFSTTTSTFASQASLAKTEGQVGVAGKLIVVFAFDDLIASFHNEIADILRNEIELIINECRSFFDECIRSNELRRKMLISNSKILNAALRLGSIKGLIGYTDFAKAIFFHSRHV